MICGVHKDRIINFCFFVYYLYRDLIFAIYFTIRFNLQNRMLNEQIKYINYVHNYYGAYLLLFKRNIIVVGRLQSNANLLILLSLMLTKSLLQNCPQTWTDHLSNRRLTEIKIIYMKFPKRTHQFYFGCRTLMVFTFTQ